MPVHGGGKRGSGGGKESGMNLTEISNGGATCIECLGTTGKAKAFHSGSKDMERWGPGSMESSNGFRNIVPRSREEYNFSTNSDAMQKERLMNRRECHKPYDGMPHPFAQTQDSCAYVDELERFSRDSCQQEYERRHYEQAKLQAKHDAKRQRDFAREGKRWNEIEADYEYEVQNAQNLKERPIAMNNQNSVYYNPITLKYQENYDGKKLQYEDDRVKYRNALRSQQTYEKSFSQPFNPITGEPYPASIPLPPVPQKPVPPETHKTITKSNFRTFNGESL